MCLAGFFAVLLGSIPGFIRKINRITVRHWRRDVICLAHHGGQSVWQQKPPSSLASIRESEEENTKICFSPAISRLGGYMRRVQAYKNKSIEEGQCCTWCWWSHVVSSSPPLDLFAFALHFPTHPLRKATRDTSFLQTHIWFLWEM